MGLFKLPYVSTCRIILFFISKIVFKLKTLINTSIIISINTSKLTQYIPTAVLGIYFIHWNKLLVNV